MAPERHTQESSRSRHSHRSRRDHDDASSVDSGYGGSAANSPKDTHDAQKDALRDYHAESAKHHAESGRRSSRSDEAKPAEPKTRREERDSDSDSDYDPRDKYYLNVDDDEHNNATSATADPLKEDQNRHITDRDRRDDRRRSDASEKHRSERRQSTASERDRRDRRERRESDASNTSRRSEHDKNRDRDRDRPRRNSASSRRHSTASEAGSDSGDRRTRRHSSSRHSDASSTRSDSRDHKEPLRRRSDASTASHSRHDSNYRSLSPIPSDSWDESSDESTARSTRRQRSGTSRSSRAPRSEAGGSRKLSPDKDGSSSKNRDASARYIDPDGEAAKSFLDKITKGVDMKSVGKVGLDAAAVAAIKIAVGTQVPWKQRIPRTITVGAAAAIMDFIVKKTNFKPKGMIGTIYARQFVEIVLANLIVNPVSSKVTGAAQNAKGKVATGKPGGGGGGRR